MIELGNPEKQLTGIACPPAMTDNVFDQIGVGDASIETA
jgi:hypothetical protein